MPLIPYPLARPLLFQLSPEHAHDLTIAALSRLQRTPAERAWRETRVDDPVTLAGVRFPNRVGLGAGLDKNGVAVDGFGAMGFGHIEVGTVTPRPQPGNPRPRMFRLPPKQALINRMGFNNHGVAALMANLQRSAERFRAGGGIVGINIGKNAATPIENAADDYVACLAAAHAQADYVAANISSPNTKNLRSLQSDAALDALLAALQSENRRLAVDHGRRVPLFVKLAPDLDDAALRRVAAALRRHGIDGVIATNTTVARDAVAGLRHADETGGLSGAPLRDASNHAIALLRSELGSGYPIIGVGGVMNADDARAKAAAGADLVQIYTGLVYRGPALAGEVARALAEPACAASAAQAGAPAR